MLLSVLLQAAAAGVGVSKLGAAIGAGLAVIGAGVGIVHDLIHFELIEAQEPVRLIQTVLPNQRRLLQGRQPIIVFIDRDKTGIIDTLHRRTLIEGG